MMQPALHSLVQLDAHPGAEAIVEVWHSASFSWVGAYAWRGHGLRLMHVDVRP
jgi:hypothetical protein